MSPRAMAEGQTVIEDAVKWLSGQWLEVGSFIATCAALFYAQLAYRSSESNTKQARAAELTSLRIQAKAGLDDAQRSLLALRSTCQANRAEWQSHRLRHGPVLGQAGSMFQSSPAEKAESRGQAILHRLGESYSSVEVMAPPELENLLQEARNASLQIMALAGELEVPPNNFK